MEARKKRFEELNISRDELNSIGEALKKEEFRNLLAEYCKEVTDPENKKLYQEEITELERQRGVDVTFINPDPGFVIKTSANGNKKAFINVSKSSNVGQPKPGNRDERGFQWSIPFSVAPPREDFDKQKNLCTVIDVVFHPYTLYLAEMRKQFRDVVVQTALDAVERHCHVTLDRANLKFPKLNFKGFSRGAVIRKKNPDFVVSEEDKEFLSQIPNPYEDGNFFTGKPQPAPKEVKTTATPGYTTPKFNIKYRNYIDMQDFTYDVNCKANAAIPKEVLVTIELPLLKTSSEPSLKLDIAENSVSLICEKPKYKLNLVLPYAVDEDTGKANFEKDTRKLVLTLPVKLQSHISRDVHLEDSGVESDPGCRVDDDAELDELPSKTSDDTSEEGDLIEVCPGEVAEYGYRTSEKVLPTPVCDNFLKEDLHYALPHYTSNSFDNTFALTLHVKNVDETTIRHRVLSGKQGLHITFASLGGGMFPQHYALCVLFPEGSSIEEDSIVIEAWDNNVVSHFKLGQCQNLPNEYYVGIDEHNLKSTPMTELLQIEMAVKDLREETDNELKHEMVIDVQQESAEEVVVELTPLSKAKSKPQSPEPAKAKLVDMSPKADAKDKSGDRSPSANQSVKPSKHKPYRRGLSESSGNDWVQTNIVRGILKRPSRSLSESNLDEYVLSDIPSSAIGSEECIASESCETGAEDLVTQKKTVRFSDHIGRKIFRVNSSILGKKNVNKLKRKKRARARRASEGDNSEGEVEHINGIIKNKIKNQRIGQANSPRLSESTEDEEHCLRRLESSEEERDKTDKENKVKRSKKRRHAKTNGRC